MVADFRRRFWISLALTVPVLATSEMVQHFLGLRNVLAFPGDRYVEFVFASAIYFYGGWPFLTGLVDELNKKLPGMMTLVGLAISVAYLYSAAVVFGYPGQRQASLGQRLPQRRFPCAVFVAIDGLGVRKIGKNLLRGRNDDVLTLRHGVPRS